MLVWVNGGTEGAENGLMGVKSEGKAVGSEDDLTGVARERKALS